jgi:ABC-type antimicrobial peptide transport system permease subunit
MANRLLGRGTRRGKEIAGRPALGAEGLRVIRQLLTESLLLAFVGAALGIALAFGLLNLLVAADLQLPVPLEEMAIDARVLGYTALLTVLTGILFGLAPALQASRPDVVPVLKNETGPAGANPSDRLLDIAVGSRAVCRGEIT